MHGADLGYRYNSPVICSDEGPSPPSPITAFEPTTWPGAHLPHVWLSPGEALYDRIRTGGYTLLHLGSDAVDISAVTGAIRARGAPVDLIRIADPQIRRVYAREFVLVRPDLHVAWRGDRLPDDPVRLAAVVTGHGTRCGDPCEERPDQ
jgi:hypothetical protein